MRVPIWKLSDWPLLKFNQAAVAETLTQVRCLHHEVIGKAAAIGLVQAGDLMSEVLIQEVMSTSAIEGEALDAVAVRSSVLRKLGRELTPAQAPIRREVDGLVEVIHDAWTGFDRPLDEDRLCRWQSALFPGGTSGIRRIAVGAYRTHSAPMQIVSGPPGKEVIHFSAPPSAQVPEYMGQFLRWFATTTPGKPDSVLIDGIARAAIAHLWFETIHPFDDGNGRIGRAIVDMALAQDLQRPIWLYSLSVEIERNRGAYYDALNAAQHGTQDASEWIKWFASAFGRACQTSSRLIDAAIEKSRFWATHSQKALNLRQRKVLQRLLDDGDGGFLGGLNAEKYIKMTGASKPTATRDLSELVQLGLLKTVAQGKALRYYICVPGWQHGIAPGAFNPNPAAESGLMPLKVAPGTF